MISKAACKLTALLISKQQIEESERELYDYGFFMLLSQLMFTAIAVISGLIFGIIWQSLIFFISFMCIRKYAGGYHASTELRCDIISTISILISIIIIKLSNIYNMKTVLLMISIAAAAVIYFLCPLDTPEKPLSDNEFKHYRKISRIILIIEFAAIVLSYFLKFDLTFSPLSICIILESILLISAKIKQLSGENKVTAQHEYANDQLKSED